MKNKFLWLMLLPLLGGVWFVSPMMEEKSEELLVDRIWLSNIPKQEREKFSLFIAGSSWGFGAFLETSVYQGNYDAFQFIHDKNRFHVRLMQDDIKADARFKAKACNEKGFDYCLELSGAPRGPVRYYSRDGWEIDSSKETLSQEMLQAHIRKLLFEN